MSAALSVFVNCPFDRDYRPLFEAILLTITASGYRVRCALEEHDGGDIRLDKLCRLIEESDRSIHDLSRTTLNDADLPRFNMPFELGLALGARRFGGRRQRRKTFCIMVAVQYRLPAYLSDLGGNDPDTHHNKPAEVIRIVRKYLSVFPDGRPLPGAAKYVALLDGFKTALPEIARSRELDAGEIDPYDDYRTYLWCMTEYLTSILPPARKS